MLLLNCHFLIKIYGFVPGFANYKKRCTRLAAHGRWFSPGTPASSTTKTGRHDIVEIFAESGVRHFNQSINQL